MSETGGEEALSEMEVLAGDKGMSFLYMWYCFQRLQDSSKKGSSVHLTVCCHHVVNYTFDVWFS